MIDDKLNGLGMTQLQETIDAIKGDPEIAHFEFRASNRWLGGGANQSTIQEFFGAKTWDASRSKPFVFVNGEPPVLLGDNEGANPVEFLLHALAGCVTTTTVLHAAARGIRIERIETQLSGGIDLQGLLGLDPDVQPGYRSIDLAMRIEADCSDDELESLVADAESRSPVCNTICRPVPVTVRRV